MITDAEFRRIATFLKQRYGIDMSQKKVIMNGRLENYLKNGGWDSFTAYMDDVEQDSSGELERMLVNFLTTNHTYFMREFEHFEFFKDVALPWAAKKEEKSKDLRVWCGAASTGEEPYMIAMVMKEFFGMAAHEWDARVLATDISTQALQHAIEGVYNDDHLKSVPDAWKRRFFQKTADDNYVVKEELKQEVIFRKFNLMEQFPFRKKMHVVFLRNVMIYFDAPTKCELVQKVYDCLEPGGYLFIGMTETLDRTSTPFQMIRPSIFRK